MFKEYSLERIFDLRATVEAKMTETGSDDPTFRSNLTMYDSLCDEIASRIGDKVSIAAVDPILYRDWRLAWERQHGSMPTFVPLYKDALEHLASVNDLN